MIFLTLFLCGIISSFAQTLNYFGQTVEMIDDNYFLLATSDTIPVDTTIVSLKYLEPINESSINSLVNSLNLSFLVGNNSLNYHYLLPDNASFDDIIASLNSSNLVASLNYSVFGEYHYITPNDPEYTDPLINYEQSEVYALMSVEDAWDYTTGDHSISIGVCDTGFDLDHEDIAVGYDTYTNYDYIHSTAFDVQNPTIGNVNDVHGHGTLVSSCISGKTNNNRGLAGIAGGWNDQGINMIVYKNNNYDGPPSSGYTSAGISQAILDGAKVINISAGFPDVGCFNSALDDAYEAGIVVVASSGNNGYNGIVYPASYQTTIAVGGTTINNQGNEVYWDITQYGSNYGIGLDFVAPVIGWGALKGGGYGHSMGTSFSSPYVAGVIGLMLSINPCLSPDNIKDILINTVDKINPNNNYTYTDGWNEYFGYGRINAKTAIEAVNNITIEGGETINSTSLYNSDYLYSTGDIIIETGGQLTISSTTSLYMSPNTKIIVKPGGELIVNGTIDVAVGCGNFWGGIEVWGDRTLAQIPYSNQGIAYLNSGSKIKNATCGILAGKEIPGGEYDLTKNGGIIFANGTTFENNITGAKLLEYPNTGVTINLSYFTLCDFITAKEMYWFYGLPKYHIFLSNVHGIDITGCTFKNDWNTYGTLTIPEYEEQGNGIYSIGSSFYLTDYEAATPQEEDKSNEFYNLFYGIHADGYSTYDILTVKNCDFSRCFRSAYVSEMSSPTFQLNRFSVPNVDDAYGIYIDHGSDFIIEENDFISSDYNAGQYGVIVYDNPYKNEIYGNSFKNFSYAFSSQGSALSIDEGVCLTCNYFDNNIEDIQVISTHGICEYQGNKDKPALNIFSTGVQNDWDLYNSGPNVIYSLPSNAQNNIRLIPDPITFLTVSLSTSATFSYTSSDVDCPSRIDDIGTVSENNAAISSMNTEIDAISQVILEETDGGDTETLDLEVLTATPEQSIEVYSDLMAEDEYLSETVLLTSAEKEVVLDNSQITDIFSNNPQSAKDIEILNKLNERSTPLSQSQWDAIILGQETIGSLESNRSDLQYLNKLKRHHNNNIIQIYKGENSQELDYNSIYQHLLNRDDLDIMYLVAITNLIEFGDLQACNSIINSIPVDYELNSYQETEHLHFIEFVQIVDDFYIGTDPSFPSQQQITILNTLISNKDRASIYAKNILIQHDDYIYQEPIDHDNTKSISEKWSPIINTDINNDRISVYPNPATTQVCLKSNTDSLEGCMIILSNLEGKKLFSKNIYESKSNVIINTGGFKPGTYNISVIKNNEIIYSKLISIIN